MTAIFTSGVIGFLISTVPTTWTEVGSSFTSYLIEFKSFFFFPFAIQKASLCSLELQNASHLAHLTQVQKQSQGTKATGSAQAHLDGIETETEPEQPLQQAGPQPWSVSCFPSRNTLCPPVPLLISQVIAASGGWELTALQENSRRFCRLGSRAPSRRVRRMLRYLPRYHQYPSPLTRGPHRWLLTLPMKTSLPLAAGAPAPLGPS